MEILVIGLGRFGYSIATELASSGTSVSVADIDELKVKNISDYVDNAFILDSTDEKSLMDISVQYFDKVIIALGKQSLNASLMTALNLKELGVENVIAKASSQAHYKLLSKIGIDNIVQPEYDMGIKIAKKIQGNCLLDYVELPSNVKLDNVKVERYFNLIELTKENLMKHFDNIEYQILV